MMKKVLLLLLLPCAVFYGYSSFANSSEEGESGKTLPRMVSLRSNLINARTGPGARYPIEWVYMQKGAPVEIVAEYEMWRKIKDWEGSTTWVHKTMLSGNRAVKVVSPGENNIYAKPDPKSKIIAKVEDQVIGEIDKCPSNEDFCLINFSGVKGWILRSHLFGVYPKENI